jgi:hypothetical protein
MFGCWTTLPAGPALLAAKHGSPIVPFSVNRRDDGTFRIAADPPIRVASDSPRDLAVATQAIATALEGHIAPAPAQWYIFKPIWPLSEAEQSVLAERHAAMMADTKPSNGKPANGRPARGERTASAEGTAGDQLANGAGPGLPLPEVSTTSQVAPEAS